MQRAPQQDAAVAEGWLVACLCAEWCGSCRDYRATFEALARQWPGWRFVWVDIEDESDALAAFELDVENFPTVLVARGDEPRFFGALLPHAATLARTLDAARRAALSVALPAAQAQGLLAQIRAIGRPVGRSQPPAAEPSAAHPPTAGERP